MKVYNPVPLTRVVHIKVVDKVPFVSPNDGCLKTLLFQ